MKNNVNVWLPEDVPDFARKIDYKKFSFDPKMQKVFRALFLLTPYFLSIFITVGIEKMQENYIFSLLWILIFCAIGVSISYIVLELNRIHIWTLRIRGFMLGDMSNKYSYLLFHLMVIIIFASCFLCGGTKMAIDGLQHYKSPHYPGADDGSSSISSGIYLMILFGPLIAVNKGHTHIDATRHRLISPSHDQSPSPPPAPGRSTSKERTPICPYNIAGLAHTPAGGRQQVDVRARAARAGHGGRRPDRPIAETRHHGLRVHSRGCTDDTNQGGIPGIRIPWWKP